MKQLKINRKIDQSQEFKISRMKEVIKPTKPHKHDGYFEVIFLTDGAGVHIIDEHHYEVEPPVLFFMDPGHVHCWEFSKIPKGYVCIFKNEFLDDTPDIKHKFVEFDTIYHLKQGKINFLSDFELLKEEYDRQSPEPHILKSYLNAILWKIAKLPVNNAQPNTKNALVASFRNLINENYYQEKEMGFYAEKLAVSKRTLSHITKKETGRPATSLINERIVEESKRLLKHTSNSVSQIAYHLNFNDPSHFIKFFKNKTNLSPGEFRSKL